MTPSPVPRRLGFLGVGWIGRHRMGAMMRTGLVREALVFDPSDENLEQALAAQPEARGVSSFEALLDAGLDGIVIATPSALHAEQARAALAASCAVFCQKPLARTAEEARAVLAAAEAANRLLRCDFSYRRTRAAEALTALVASGACGRVFAAELVFHNAYGPDKAWFYDPRLAGGGCMMDLGVHLLDLLRRVIGDVSPEEVRARLFAKGAVHVPGSGVEDFAVADLEYPDRSVRLSCSWTVSAGREAEIGARFFGDKGGAAFRNVGGSFYDFEAVRLEGPRESLLAGPPDDWGGRVGVDWLAALASGAAFDPEEARAILWTSELLDRIYAAAGRP